MSLPFSIPAPRRGPESPATLLSEYACLSAPSLGPWCPDDQRRWSRPWSADRGLPGSGRGFSIPLPPDQTMDGDQAGDLTDAGDERDEDEGKRQHHHERPDQRIGIAGGGEGLHLVPERVQP